MLLRTITGLTGLAILLGALWAGLFWVFLVTLIAVILALREFYWFHPPNPSPVESGPAEAGLPPVRTGNPHSSEAAGAALSFQIPSDAPHSGPPTPESGYSPQASLQSTPTDIASDEGPAPPSSEIEPTPEPSQDQPAPTPLPTLLGAAWAAAFVIGGAAAEGVLHLWAISLAVFLAGSFLSILWLIAFYRDARWPAALAYLLGGPVYTGFLLAHVMALAQVGEVFFFLDPLYFSPDTGPTIYEVGRNWLLFALLANFATDTGAFLVGRSLGRHKMAPVTSPNKTWEGAVGGFLFALLAAIVLDRTLNLGLGPTWWEGAWNAWNWQPVLIGATVGVASQLGDLAESRLKRLSRLKDSGNLMPGHGGILDRLDSLLFTIPTVYYLLVAVL
ncbi:MAG: phosphatidate cytidylyltransferase [Chloroflexota bacterium]|nr:phosphatidate cytidylyltransferase [Chloroflexota bacterium]